MVLDYYTREIGVVVVSAYSGSFAHLRTPV